MSQLPHILSDYMLVFAVPVLTHDPNFTNYEDPIQLKQLEKCLWLILEPLISNKEFFCFGFYKNLIDRMKHHKDSYKSDDDATNCVSNTIVTRNCDNSKLLICFQQFTATFFFSFVQKMWAICDIAMHVIYTKSTNYDTRDFPLDARIPNMYFQAQPDSFKNNKLYVPIDMFTATATSKKMGIVLPVARVSKTMPFGVSLISIIWL